MLINTKQIIQYITFICITCVGIYFKEVTIFYLIYLFWIQEFLKVCIDAIIAYRYRNSKNRFPSKSFYILLGILAIYLVFIVIVFGLMMDSSNAIASQINFETITFRNIFFNLTLIVYLFEYLLFRRAQGWISIAFEPFSKQHIVIHLSILLGAMMLIITQGFFDMNEYNRLFYFITALPFMTIRIWSNHYL